MECDSKIIALLESIDGRLDGFLSAASLSSMVENGHILKTSQDSISTNRSGADLKGTAKGTAVKSTVGRESDPAVSIIPQNDAQLGKTKAVETKSVNVKFDGYKVRLQGGAGSPEVKTGAQKPASAHKAPSKVVSKQVSGEKADKQKGEASGKKAVAEAPKKPNKSERIANPKTITKYSPVTPNPGSQKSASKEALTEKRKNDQAQTNNKGLLRSLGTSFTFFGEKVADQIKEGGGNGDGKGKDAAGLAAGGPLWGAVQEVTEFAAELKEDDSLTGKTATSLFKKFAGEKADGEGGGALEPKKDKNGRFRDANGHFIKQPMATAKELEGLSPGPPEAKDLPGATGSSRGAPAPTVTTTAKEGRLGRMISLGGKPSTDKSSEIVKTNTTLSEKKIESSEKIQDAITDGDKEDERRHRQLLKAVAKISTGGSAEDGSFLGDLLGEGKRSKKGKRAKKAKGPAGKLKKAFNGLSQRGSKALSPLKKIFSLGEAGGKGVSKGVEKLGGKGLGKLGGKGLAKLGGKGLGKSLLKKIPGIGLLMGGGFAINRLMSGDLLGALGELGSGAASMIPGVGTAASVAIDAALMARDAGVLGAKNGAYSSDGKIKQAEDLSWFNGGIDHIASEKKNMNLKDPNVDVSQTINAPDKTGMVAGRIDKPAPGPIVKPIVKKAAPVRTSHKEEQPARESAQPVVVVKKAEGVKERKQASQHNIPTEFDDTVLVLMAHDRL